MQRLAIDGGTPQLPEGPPIWPPPDERVLAAMQAAYADASWGRYDGPHGERLGAALVEMHGVEHALLCSSGTFAGELALRALRVGAGDEVILAAYDFAGNFRAVEAVDALPVLVDIDPATWSLDAAQLDTAHSDRTRAVIVSHLHGGLADMRAMRHWADERNVAIVEDACQCPGAIVQGRTAGTWGDAGVLSFGGSKLLTAGRGGALLTRDPAIHQRARVFCERGNNAFPLSELQAAVLLPQVESLATWNALRAESVARLLSQTAALADLVPVKNPPDRGEPAYYKLAWHYLPAAEDESARERFTAAVRAEGVALDAGFRGMGRRPDSRCRKVGMLTASHRAAAQTVLLHHPVLLQPVETIDRVAGALAKVNAGLGD